MKRVTYGPPERVPGSDFAIAYRKFTVWWKNGIKYGVWEWVQKHGE